jgi:pilus assembly protein CpaE
LAEKINILMVSPDPRFREELESALASLDELHPVIYHASDIRQAVEATRSRRPQIALVEMGSDVRPLLAFAEEAAFVSPETTVAAVFRPDAFAPDVPESTIFISAIRGGVKDFLRRPVSSSELAELLRRIQRSEIREAGCVGRIVSFVSNKGGVGKSTTSVNAACGLAVRHPNRVLLIDASLQMGVCASLLDITPTTTLSDVVREKHRLDETLIRQLAVPHSSGLHLLSAPADAVDAGDVDDEVMSRILTVARRTYDFVIVDTFPMLDRAIVAVLDHSDRVYVIVENVVPTVLGAVKLMEVLRSLGLSQERLRIVLNRYTTLPGSVNPADVANRLGHAVDHVIPFDKGIVIAANTGEPYVLRPRRFFGCGRRLRQLVDEIDAMTEIPPVSLTPSSNGEAKAGGSERADGRVEFSPPLESDVELIAEPGEEDPA